MANHTATCFTSHQIECPKVSPTFFLLPCSWSLFLSRCRSMGRPRLESSLCLLPLQVPWMWSCPNFFLHRLQDFITLFLFDFCRTIHIFKTFGFQKWLQYCKVLENSYFLLQSCLWANTVRVSPDPLFPQLILWVSLASPLIPEGLHTGLLFPVRSVEHFQSSPHSITHCGLCRVFLRQRFVYFTEKTNII